MSISSSPASSTIDSDSAGTPAPLSPRARFSGGFLSATDALQAQKYLYMPMTSVYARFPGLNGLLLLNKIFEAYRVMLPGADQMLPFYSSDGAELLVDHPLNCRHQTLVVKEYCESVLKNGNVPGVRGAPWAVLSTGNTPPYKLITYRTLSKAVYMAKKVAPENPLVIASIEAGLPNAVLFDCRIPEDVVIWLRDYHNGFHNGASTSFVEVLKAIPQLEADWFVFATKHSLTVRGCGTGDASWTARW